MCSVTLAAAGISAAAAIGGSVYGAQQQKKASNAIAAQNQTTQLAQAKAFDQRINAQTQQTGGDLASYIQQIQSQTEAGRQMRDTQQSAREHQASILDAENRQQDANRQAADQQAQTLLDRTSGAQLAAGQQDAAARQQGLLETTLNDPNSPDPTAPNASTTHSDEGRAANTRRMAQAATNIRDYGQKIAANTAFGQPVQDVGQAIAANQVGVMPAAQASKLLGSGSQIRLLPSQMEYQGASSVGSAMDQLITSRGQGQRAVNALTAGNQTGLANLQQSDTDTLAANKAEQAKQDAAYGQSVGNIISGIGNLGLYGAGYYGGDKTGLVGKFPGLFGTPSK